MGYDDEKQETCRCKKSICWLVLSFCGLCCVTFVVFLFICSLLFPSFGIGDHQLGPLIVYPSNRIVFNMSNIRNSTESYIKILRNITAEYQCTDDERLDDEQCDVQSTCDFNASSHLGADCSPEANFGYLRQRPCVLLRLERVLVKDLKSPTSRSNWPPHLPVNCQGVRRVDQGRMRKYKVFPERGFGSNYYYTTTTLTTTTTNVSSTSTCRQPATLVAVHFPDLTTGTNITIMCSVLLPNVVELNRPRVTFSIEIV